MSFMFKTLKAHFTPSVSVLSYLPDGGFTGIVEVRGVYTSRRRAFREFREIAWGRDLAEYSLSEWRDNVEITVHRWDAKSNKPRRSWPRPESK